MPNFDKTGPKGEGSKTGRGRGQCAQNGQAGNTKPVMGMGLGQRMGRGLGLRRKVAK